MRSNMMIHTHATLKTCTHYYYIMIYISSIFRCTYYYGFWIGSGWIFTYFAVIVVLCVWVAWHFFLEHRAPTAAWTWRRRSVLLSQNSWAKDTMRRASKKPQSTSSGRNTSQRWAHRWSPPRCAWRTHPCWRRWCHTWAASQITSCRFTWPVWRGGSLLQ